MGKAAGAVAVVTGGLLQLEGGRQQGRAARRAADARLAQERSDRELALGFVDEFQEQIPGLSQSITDAAEPTPEELSALQSAIETNEREIARKEELLESVDPVLMESMDQALQLLQGQDAAILDPLRRQRDSGRAELENRLRAQLGSGYETSAIGQRALQKYDQDTATQLTLAQDQSVGRLLGVAQNTRQFASLSPNIQANQGIAQQFGQIQNRRMAGAQAVGNLFRSGSQSGISAITGAPINNVGGAALEDLIRGRAVSQVGGSLANVGGMMFAEGGQGGGAGGGGGQRVIAGQPDLTAIAAAA
jgi:hypothetical protein